MLTRKENAGGDITPPDSGCLIRRPDTLPLLSYPTKTSRPRAKQGVGDKHDRLLSAVGAPSGGGSTPATRDQSPSNYHGLRGSANAMPGEPHAVTLPDRYRARLRSDRARKDANDNYKAATRNQDAPDPDPDPNDAAAPTTTGVTCSLPLNKTDKSKLDRLERKRDLNCAVQWTRQEFATLKQEDRLLMRQLLDLRAQIHALRGMHSCHSVSANLSAYTDHRPLVHHSDGQWASTVSLDHVISGPQMTSRDYDVISDPRTDSPITMRELLYSFNEASGASPGGKFGSVGLPIQSLNRKQSLPVEPVNFYWD